MGIRTFRNLAAAMTTALAVCACGGGGGSLPQISLGGVVSTPTPAPTGTPSPLPSATPMASAVFSITVPAAIAGTSDARHPRYVSPNTRSLAITLVAVNGKTSSSVPVVVPVGYGLSGCPAQSGAPLACSVTVPVPAQAYDTFTVATFASQDGTGTPLSTATITQTFATGQSTAVPLSLGGVVASIAMSPSVIHTVQGAGTGSYPLSLTVRDASGAVILGTTPFQSPISVSVQNDPQNAVFVSQSTIVAPGAPFQVRYDGSKTLADGQIVANAGALGTAKTDVIPLSFTPASIAGQMGGAAQQITVSEVGFTGAFTATIDYPNIATPTVRSTGPGTATIDVAPAPLGGSSGFATVTIGDGSRSTSVRVTVAAPVLPGITYYPQASTFRPSWMTLAPSGKIYLTTTAMAIAEFDPATQALNTYSFSSFGFGNPRGMALDPAGNLWIGGGFFPARLCEMMAADHSFACYTTGLQSGANTFGLALGPDGAIWFCDGAYGSPAIGRIDPVTHVIAEYTAGLLPTAQPSGIVAGTDGNMYFSDVGSTAAFGSISTTTHQIAEYTDGIQQYNPQTQQTGAPYKIVLGSDGNIWAADPGEPAIDEFVIAQHQTIQHFNGIQRYGNPIAITSAPNGDLWFSDSGLFGADLLGNVKVGSAVIQEYGGFPATATQSVTGIVATSAHDLWFFDEEAHAMGHAPIP